MACDVVPTQTTNSGIGLIGLCFARAVYGTITGWWELWGGSYIWHTHEDVQRVNQQQSGQTDVELGDVQPRA